MTSKQRSYLGDLIVRHPNFKQTYGYSGTYQDEADDVWLVDEDGNKMGKSEDFMVAWINEKYADKLNNPISNLEELDNEEASALITHLQLGEKEREL